MTGPIRAGWYRMAGDAPHQVRRVSGSECNFVTCLFDITQGCPCDGAGVLSDEAWRRLQPASAPSFLRG
jgi:hypothetical protein